LVLSGLRRIDGYTAKATITTDRVTNNISRNVGPTAARGGRIGSAAMANQQGSWAGITARAIGGTIQAGEYTLVGELGPELVKLPTGSFVNTAQQTERMFGRSMADNLGGTSGIELQDVHLGMRWEKPLQYILQMH
jgi:phage-related minor tail protein